MADELDAGGSLRERAHALEAELAAARATLAALRAEGVERRERVAALEARLGALEPEQGPKTATVVVGALFLPVAAFGGALSGLVLALPLLLGAMALELGSDGWVSAVMAAFMALGALAAATLAVRSFRRG